jgi:predicted porin
VKKVWFAITLALAFGGTANAQVSLYGLIDASYGKSLNSDVFVAQSKADFHSGGDNESSEGNSTTRVGIKGAFDIGTGVKAHFRLETGGIDSDGQVNAGGAFFNRQAWFGISGGFGELRIGRQDSVPFQTMIDFDFNGASNGVSAGAYSRVGVWNRGRQSRSLQYILPVQGGLTAQLGFQPKGNYLARLQPATTKDVYSVGLKYAARDLLIGASFQTKDNNDVTGFASFAGSYDFKAVKLMLGYTDGGEADNGGIGKGPTLGIVVPVAGWTLGLHYAQNDDSALKIRSSEVFVNKEVLKNTFVYLEAGNWKTSKDMAVVKKSGKGYAVGVIFVF